MHQLSTSSQSVISSPSVIAQGFQQMNISNSMQMSAVNPGARVRVIVSTDAPHYIYATEMHMDGFLGRTEIELHGQSISILCGPFTDTEVLFSAISNAATLKTTSNIIMFNDIYANQFEFLVTCSPFLDDYGLLKGCMLAFEIAPQVSYFGHQAEEPLSASAGIPHANPAGEIGFFKTAGTTAPSTEPSSPDGSYCSPYASESDRPGPGARGQPSGVRVFPRRKRGLDPESPIAAVTVSLEAIRALQDLPVTDAAGRLGISATAFKKACRKLGIERWTYRRVPGPPTDEPAPVTAARRLLDSPTSPPPWTASPSSPVADGPEGLWLPLPSPLPSCGGGCGGLYAEPDVATAAAAAADAAAAEEERLDIALAAAGLGLGLTESGRYSPSGSDFFFPCASSGAYDFSL